MSSLEVIAVHDKPSKETYSSPKEVIEITSEEDASFKKSPGPTTYPSSPQSLRKSLPSEYSIQQQDIIAENKSIELAASFQDDTNISESSEALGVERTIGSSNKRVAAPKSSLAIDSSPLKNTQKENAARILEELLSDEPYSDTISFHKNSRSEFKEPSTLTAIGAKWSQVQIEPTNDQKARKIEITDSDRREIQPRRTLAIKRSHSYDKYDSEADKRLDRDNSVNKPVSLQNSKKVSQISLLVSRAVPSESTGDSTYTGPASKKLRDNIPGPKSQTINEDEGVDLDLAEMADESSYLNDPKKFIAQNDGPKSSTENHMNFCKALSTNSTGIESSSKTVPATNLDSRTERHKHKALQRFIVHGKTFSKEESWAEAKKFMKTSTTKKAFNAANKIIKNADALREEILIDMDEELLKVFADEGISLSTEISPTKIIHAHTDKHLIKFRRNCNSICDYNSGIFYPCKERIVEEKVSLVFYDSLEFFHSYKRESSTIVNEFERLKRKDKKIILVLNKYSSLEKSLSNFENRKYKEKVQNELDSSLGVKQTKRRSKKDSMLEELQMCSKDLECEVSDLAIRLGVHVFASTSHQEFVIWLKNLITVIGRTRYDPLVKHLEWSHINVKSGQNPSDVLCKTLEQLNKMTRAKAQRVVSVYPKFQLLFEDFNKGFLTSGKDGNPLMSSAAESALLTLLTSDNPEELIYID